MPPITVLTFVDYYLPGVKGGGPIRTVANMAEQIGGEFRFKVVTRDRDLGDDVAFPSVTIGQWCQIGQADVQYLQPQGLTLWGIGALVRNTGHDVVYLNSFFSLAFTIVPLVLRRLQLIPNRPVILAPRGEFSPGAITMKYWKKRVYLAVSQFIGLYRNVVWQASSPLEQDDIRRWFGATAVVIIAPDMRSEAPAGAPTHARLPKVSGTLKALFLSRLSRKKNLAGALRALQDVRGDIQLSIYGPLEDQEYWRECQEIARTLPANITVHYAGVAAHEHVGCLMAAHDLFFFPTHGENFGHVILEALVAGCPVLISDQTPWQGLQELGVGWSIPLDDQPQFQKVLQQFADMDEQEWSTWSARARTFGWNCAQDQDVVQQNRRLFQAANQLASLPKNGRQRHRQDAKEARAQQNDLCNRGGSS